MIFPKNGTLKIGQIKNPILYTSQVPLEGLPTIDEADLRQIFTSKGHQLKTWGRTPGTKTLDPHWIAIHHETPMHTDPGYPRYTHQIMLKIDPFCLRGVNGEQTPLTRGTYLTLDTWSPHQVFALSPLAQWYIAVSLDDHRPHSEEEMVPVLRDYAQRSPFLTDEILIKATSRRAAR